MIAKVTTRFDVVEKQKSEILARVAALEESNQRTPPHKNVWSPLQIIQHLLLFEKEYLNFIASGERQNVGTKRATRSPILWLLLYIMQKRISVPTLPTMEPPATVRPLAELTVEWNAVREQLRERLALVTDATYETPISLNPLLGPMNASQILQVMEAHQAYHLAQIPAR